MSTPTTDNLLARRQKTLGEHAMLFYDTPLELVSGRGVWVKDPAGNTYLDAYNNVPHVGHAHPAVADAVFQQMSRLSLHTRYLNGRVVDYAEALLGTFHASLDRVAFSNSGSEANELALRVARFASQSTGVLISDHSYHGTTLTLAHATTALRVSEPLGDNVRAIRIPDATGMNTEEEARLLAASLAEVDAAIASLQEAGHGVAAVILDTLFSTEGLVRTPAGYIEGLITRTHAAGGFYISDEVQSGFGRAGSVMWGHERFSAVPDMVTLGKPMGNGHPIGATILRADMLAAFSEQNQYFNTFGGNPVSAAAGHAVLGVMETEGMRERAQELGAFLKDELTTALRGVAHVESVRGEGLFVGMRFVDPVSGEADGAAAKRVVEQLRRNHVLISRVGRFDEVLKIRPPLAFEREHADILLDKLTSVITDH